MLGISSPLRAPKSKTPKTNLLNEGFTETDHHRAIKNPAKKPGFLLMAVREGFEPSIGD